MFDLYPCAQSSLTDLGHDSYTMRHCPQCAGAFAVCAVCEAPALCPGCRHRTVLAQIAAGEVVFPAVPQASREGTAPTAVARGRADVVVDQAGELTHVTDQAVPLDAGSSTVYAEAVGQSHQSHDAPSNGAPHVDTQKFPFVLLVLPVDLAGVPPVLQALAAVIAPQAMNGHTNGHIEADTGSPPRLPRKTYLSDTQCPSRHTYQDTGKALRFHGNNQCVPCSGQRRPRRTAASQEG